MKKYTIYRFAILLAFQWLSSCHVSKNLPLAVNDVPSGYRYAQTDTATAADIPWQIFFTDTSLQLLIVSALQQNFDLQDAVKNIEAARLLLQQARLGNLPSFNLQAGAAYNRPSDNSLNGQTLNTFLNSSHVEDYSLGASVSWEADIWGKIKNSKAAALAAYLQTKETAKAVRTRLISDIAKGYYNLLKLDAALQIASKNIGLSDSVVQIVRWQFCAGQVTSLAVQQADAQKLFANALVPQFEQAIAVQENALSVLSGKEPGPIQRAATIDSIIVNDRIGTGVPAALLSRRPDIRFAELDLDKANAAAGYAKANLYPSLTITAQGGLDALKFSNWFNIPASLFGAVAGGLTQPLFRQKALQTQYKIALINREKAVIHFRGSMLIATGEVAGALIAIDKLGEQQLFTAQRTDTLELAIHNARLLFSNGLATYLEVITASSNVLQAELEMVSIKTSRMDATVDLYRSLGGGIK